MTYSLPFGLKQKPISHYFEHGVIRFKVIVQKFTQNWLKKFTFNEKWQEYERSLTH